MYSRNVRSDISLSDPLPDIICRNCSFSWRSPKGGGGRRLLLLSQKAYCRTHLMFFNTHPPISSYSSSPLSPEICFEIQNDLNAQTLPFPPPTRLLFLHQCFLVKSYRLRVRTRGRADTLQCPAAQFLQYCQDVAAARKTGSYAVTWTTRERETEKAS